MTANCQAGSTAMSEPENRCAPTDENRDSKQADLPPEATAGDESRNAEAERVEHGETNGRPAVTPAAGSGDPRRTSPLFPDEPRLKGPQIPNAEVSESGVFTVRIGDTEVYETAEVEFGLGCGLDEARPIEWLWPQRIAQGTV